MVYHMNKGDQPTYTIEYTPHDRDFYEVRVDGLQETASGMVGVSELPGSPIAEPQAN